jgi:hypothetical protein
MFEGFEGEGIKVNMCKLGIKKNLVGSWEGPYVFVVYKDGKGFQEQNEGGKTCTIKDMDKKHWEWVKKDLQIYHYVG